MSTEVYQLRENEILASEFVDDHKFKFTIAATMPMRSKQHWEITSYDLAAWFVKKGELTSNPWNVPNSDLRNGLMMAFTAARKKINAAACRGHLWYNTETKEKYPSFELVVPEPVINGPASNPELANRKDNPKAIFQVNLSPKIAREQHLAIVRRILRTFQNRMETWRTRCGSLCYNNPSLTTEEVLLLSGNCNKLVQTIEGLITEFIQQNAPMFAKLEKKS